MRNAKDVILFTQTDYRFIKMIPKRFKKHKQK